MEPASASTVRSALTEADQMHLFVQLQARFTVERKEGHENELVVT